MPSFGQGREYESEAWEALEQVGVFLFPETSGIIVHNLGVRFAGMLSGLNMPQLGSKRKIASLEFELRISAMS